MADERKVVFITGAAKRVGAVIAQNLHAHGMNIIIHYHSSANEAESLCNALNQNRPDSACSLSGNLSESSLLPGLISAAAKRWGRLDVLINNASSFYPTPIGNITEQNWDDLMGVNVKAPLFLSQAAVPHLAKQNGCIINIVDIYARQPLPKYPVYCVAKAGLLMLTKVLAKELGPEIRVNAVAPGAILWSDDSNELDESTQEKIIARNILKRLGTPDDIAKAVYFFIADADYVTGQILPIDGGRTLNY